MPLPRQDTRAPKALRDAPVISIEMAVVFKNIAYEVEEIELGRNVALRAVRDIRESLDTLDPVKLRAAAEQLATTAGQLSILGRHLEGLIGRRLMESEGG